jgi:heterodisulfide reductase subunit B
MKFAVQRCCTTSVFLKEYESSTDLVLKKLGVEFLDIKEFNCCGYPLKNVNFKAHVLASARNLALAEREKVHILTFCNCCYGTLKSANHDLKQNAALRDHINGSLEKEGLRYDGGVEVWHLLEVFYKYVGVENIKEKLVKSFKGVKIAAQYGCHLLRPSKILQFDDPLAPSIFEELVHITGAETVPWQMKLECCGSPLWGIEDDLSMKLTEKKILDAKRAGADFLCAACPYCQIQFDRVQKIVYSNNGDGLSSIVYTQLLALSMGVEGKTVGLPGNEAELNSITCFLS